MTNDREIALEVEHVVRELYKVIYPKCQGDCQSNRATALTPATRILRPDNPFVIGGETCYCDRCGPISRENNEFIVTVLPHAESVRIAEEVLGIRDRHSLLSWWVGESREKKTSE
jgi:hypothetical protein